MRLLLRQEQTLDYFEYGAGNSRKTAISGSFRRILRCYALTSLSSDKHVLVRTEKIIIGSAEIFEIRLPGSGF